MNSFNIFALLIHHLSMRGIRPTVKLGNRLPWWLKWYRICLQCGRPSFDPWVGKIPWGRKWQPTPVFLLGESRGWRSLVGCDPWGR